MTIEQTVEIPRPEDAREPVSVSPQETQRGVGPLNAAVTVNATGRRLTIDVPREIPAGPVIITFTPNPAENPVKKSAAALLALRGIHEGEDTMERFLERHCAEAERERAEERERYPWAFKDKP